MLFSFQPIHTYSPSNAIGLATCSSLAYKADSAIISGFTQKIGQYLAFASFRTGDPPGFGISSPSAAAAGSGNANGGCPAQEVIICFQGTADVHDWLDNLDAKFTPLPGAQRYNVHAGFWNALDTLWKGVSAFLAGNAASGNVPVYLCGHSLGGAMAALAAARLWLPGGSEYGKQYAQGGLYTYGQPRVGDDAFASAISDVMKGQYYRFVNNDDVVPHVPPWAAGFRHGGTLMYFDAQQNLIAKPSWATNMLDDLGGEIRALASLQPFPQICDHSIDNGYLPALIKNQQNNPFH